MTDPRWQTVREAMYYAPFPKDELQHPALAALDSLEGEMERLERTLANEDQDHEAIEKHNRARAEKAEARVNRLEWTLDAIATDATITPDDCPEPWRSTLISWARLANDALAALGGEE